VTPADNDRLPLTRATKYGEVVRDEERLLVRPDGTKVWLLCNAGPIIDRDGKLTGGVIAWRDITDRKRTEDELRRRTKELARSNDDLQRFAYAVSHDLQEPLRTIASFTELMSRRTPVVSNPEVQQDLRFIKEAVSRMKKLIEDLLRYSSVSDGGDLQTTPMNSQVALGEALSNLQSAIDEVGATITHDALPDLIGNQPMICQVFQNLIGNAIKYRRKGTPPRVHVSAELQSKMWLFSVADNGIGMEMEYAEKIFGMFQRLHGRGEYSGSGIGLAIVRRIVERHGGRVWAQSTVGEGSTFYFTLPSNAMSIAETGEFSIRA
jgi:light-regulated signal transduction histidine kinase (bacteriophytochrome)